MSAPGQYSWRYALPEKKVLRLGSDPAFCDWVVPEDRMISRFHATLEWTARRADRHAARRAEAGVPHPPQNHIWYFNKPVETCTVKPGEWFVIGQTRFTLRGDDASDPKPRWTRPSCSGRRSAAGRTRTHAVLQPGDDPQGDGAVAAVPEGRVERAGALSADVEGGALRDAKCDAAAIVRIPPDCPVGDTRVTVRRAERANPVGGATGEFLPSRKLVRRAVCQQRKMCLHVWSTDPSNFSPMGGSDHNLNARRDAPAGRDAVGHLHAVFKTTRSTRSTSAGGSWPAAAGNQSGPEPPQRSTRSSSRFSSGCSKRRAGRCDLRDRNAVIREAWGRPACASSSTTPTNWKPC